MKYPFSPELLDALPEELAELFRGLELKLLQEICERLNLADQLNEVTVQSIRALRSQGIPLDEIQKAIRETSGISQKKLDELFDDVIARNQAYYTELIDLAKVTVPQTLVDASDIEAIRAQAFDEFRNLTRSMGFLVDNGRTFLQPAKAYQHVLDSAELQVQSGAISYNEAIRNAVRQLADSGLCVAYDKNGNLIENHVQYESKRINHLDVAVRRAVMTGINQINQKYSIQSMDYLETDLVQVSAHVGARDIGDVPENHRLWQGKIYRWSAKPRNSTGDYPDFEEVCGYGLGEGIGGWNCHHTFSPFVEGVMERTYTDEQLENFDPEPFEFEGKEYTAYAATQKQRQIETEIRKWKRRKAAFEAAGNAEDATAAGARLRRLNDKYRAFSEAAGLPMQWERMEVLYK